MNTLDVEAVLHAEFHNGFGCEYHESRLHECSKFQRAAHVAAVLRVEIAEWLTDDQTYREVAARSILNQGAADTACRSLANQINPYRPTLAATEGD